MSKRAGIQLCYPFDEQRLKKWEAPYILQPKIDGERCRAVVDSSGFCTLLSSEENTITSVPHIDRAIEGLRLRSIELDGELYVHGADFSTIHSIVSRRKNIHPDAQYMEYHIFDIVSNDAQRKRINILFDTIPIKKTFISHSPIQLVPCRFVASIDEIMSGLDDYLNEHYEGFVIRDSDAPYVRRYSPQMMKFKPRKEDIYEIIGTQEEISIEGVAKDSLGALLCRGSDDSTFGVGSGSLLTRDGRKELWQKKDTLVGKWARVKYQSLTHARGVPRFPVVVEIIDNDNIT